MAILATRRRWLVTSLCAASRSSCSRQRLASMYSSCGSSIGNLRISERYRESPDSAVRIGSAAVRAIDVRPPFMKPPDHTGGLGTPTLFQSRRRTDVPRRDDLYAVAAY